MGTGPGSDKPVRVRRSQQARREASRAAILVAAREEFLERGFQVVSLHSIAARAGLTRGAVYHQFRDKSALLREVVEAEAAAIAERLRERVSQIEHPIDKIRGGIDVYLAAINDPRVLRLIHVDFPAFCGAERWTLDSPWLAYTENLLAQAVEGRQIRPISTKAMARLILAFVRESLVALIYSKDQKATWAEMSGALDALFEGLRRDGAGAAST